MQKNRILLVIVISYNSMPWAKKCYDSLRLSKVPCDVVTIDNGSTDGTQDYIRRNYPEVELIQSEMNLGFGKANNIGFQKAIDEGYEFVYLLNQDAWIMPETFEVLLNVSKKHPEYGILSPMHLQSDKNHFDKNFLRSVIGSYQQRGASFVNDLYNGRRLEIYEVSRVMAAHWLITRKCLEIVGGFSPTFPHYGEDDNYADRVNYWELKLGIVPEAKAVHDRSDPNWSNEKTEYVCKYIDALVRVSKPFWRSSLKMIVMDYFYESIKNRNRNLFKYAFRLLKDRKTINLYYDLSLQKKAFLK